MYARDSGLAYGLQGVKRKTEFCVNEFLVYIESKGLVFLICISVLFKYILL